jgi:hypothetical protein
MVEVASVPLNGRTRRNPSVAFACLALAAVALIGVTVQVEDNAAPVEDISDLLDEMNIAQNTEELAVPIRPPPLPVPWSPPDNLYLYWGPEVDKRTSAEAVRHEVKMGNIAGGEYRSPNFIMDLTGQKFRDLTMTCCNVLLFPPFKDGFPIFKANGMMRHRISRFVSNGNTMIFTGGGLLSSLFINRYFKYNLEPVAGNYDPGPFPKYQAKKLPKSIRRLPDILRQEGTEVTVMQKFSLPAGTKVAYASPMGSPFFIIKYCEVMNPMKGEPPIKVTPPFCPRWKKKGHKCACGNIIYLGYDYRDASGLKWNKALRSTLGLTIGKPQ